VPTTQIAQAVNSTLLFGLLQRLQQLDEINAKLDRLKKIDSIDRKLTGKKAVLKVTDALRFFGEHLLTGVNHRGQPFKKPENYEYVLRMFAEEFGGRNLPDVTPEEIDAFLRKYWESPSTIRQRRNELSAFFSWCIMLLRKRRQPTFSNPCQLLEPVHSVVKKAEFIETSAMKEIIESAYDERQWLIFAIMATAGLRVSEVLKLRKEDIRGRVLTLLCPKSGKDLEQAVITASVAKRAEKCLRLYDPDYRPFNVRRNTVYKALQARGTNPHALRKWCITFWDRHGEEGMSRFVRRHNTVSLRERYVAPLTIAEVMKKQQMMERELWK
jgi:integrase